MQGIVLIPLGSPDPSSPQKDIVSKKMNLDKLDIKIIRIFYNLRENEETSTWKIMDKMFSGLKGKYEKESKHNLIKSRIKRLRGELFDIEKLNGKWQYSLISNNIKFCKHKFPNGIKNCLMVFISNKWIILEF